MPRLSGGPKEQVPPRLACWPSLDAFCWSRLVSRQGLSRRRHHDDRNLVLFCPAILAGPCFHGSRRLNGAQTLLELHHFLLGGLGILLELAELLAPLMVDT